MQQYLRVLYAGLRDGTGYLHQRWSGTKDCVDRGRWGKGGERVGQTDGQVESDVHFEQMHLQNHRLYALYDSALAIIISYQSRDRWIDR